MGGGAPPVAPAMVQPKAFGRARAVLVRLVGCFSSRWRARRAASPLLSMLDTEDPARLFFPDESEIDLYGVLNLKKEEDPSVDTIRKAYRKLALRYHPDKAQLHSGGSETDSLRFQQIGFAYSVLSDEKRRKKYDATGSTSDSIWDGDEAVDWNEYFKTLWTGEVSGKTLEEFKASYQGTWSISH